MVNPDGLEIDALHSNFRLDMFAAGPRPLWRWLKDDQLYCFADGAPVSPAGRIHLTEGGPMPGHKVNKPLISFVGPPPRNSMFFIPGLSADTRTGKAPLVEACMFDTSEHMNRDGVRIVWLLWWTKTAPGWTCATRLRDRRPVWFPPRTQDIPGRLKALSRRRKPVSTYETDPAYPALMTPDEGDVRIWKLAPRIVTPFDLPPPVGAKAQAARRKEVHDVVLVAIAPIYAPGETPDSAPQVVDWRCVWRIPRSGLEFLSTLRRPDQWSKWRGPLSVSGYAWDDKRHDYDPGRSALLSAAAASRANGITSAELRKLKRAPSDKPRYRLDTLSLLVEPPPLGFRQRLTGRHMSTVSLIRVEPQAGGKPLLWWRTPHGKLARSVLGDPWLYWTLEGI